MLRTDALDHPAPLPVGHTVEVTELEAAVRWKGRVTACTIVMVEGLENPRTTLQVETDA
ncbi:hypothetical protein H1Q78_14645 [Cellulosimicrobium cellulans]|uniref:hypothetical protein n=1 Tax=Cellulosimicrobium cellulans TaxID=1710 RepID=UPI001EDA006F|nr:hypothetical protein [Cellulosimicrobium cellulans]UKJ62948.1 hypothetical protein H1Q78_14645 [Cellulosimicrobium cellulans]